MTIEWLLIYVALGALIGLIAGLFGVGGGFITTPLLVIAFAAQNLPNENLIHLALGTSFACIVFTSLSSLIAHHRHGAVLWNVVRWMGPGLLAGTLIGTQFVSYVPQRTLAIIFTAVAYCIATQILLNAKPKPTRQLPGNTILLGVGGIIGMVSSLVAAGGGFLSIPFMTMCNVQMHKVVGTSSALGFPIAIAGAIGYMWIGLNEPNLPAHSIGYVYLPALLGVVIASMTLAPLGAKLAHRLPAATLKRLLALLLYGLATKMLWTVLH